MIKLGNLDDRVQKFRVMDELGQFNCASDILFLAGALDKQHELLVHELFASRDVFVGHLVVQGISQYLENDGFPFNPAPLSILGV